MIFDGASSRLFLALVFVLAAATPPEAQAEILRFREVEAGQIYRGSQPETLEDFAFLQSLGIRTLLDLRTSSDDITRERRLGKAFGFRVLNRQLNGFFGPSLGDLGDEELDEIQDLLKDPRLHPIFVHCRHGKDRTGLVVGIYRVETQGWSPEHAYREMRSLGFTPLLLGLWHRFWDRMENRGSNRSLSLAVGHPVR